MNRSRIDPLYAKAPFVLLRFPVLLSALALGICLLTLVVVLYPLGLSVAGNRFLQGEIEEGIVTAYGMGITYENENVRFDMTAPGAPDTPLYERQEELFEEEIAEIDQLGEVLTSVRGPQVTLGSESDSRDARLFYREDALAHVRILEGEPGDGVFISDYAAEPLGLQPGDTVALGSGNRTLEVEVGGIYAALFRQEPAGFWRPWRSSILPPCPGDPGTSGCTPPPPFVLVGKQQIIELSQRLGKRAATFGWDAPLRDVASFTLEEAEQLERSYRSLAGRMSDPDSSLYDVFLCCGPQYIEAESYLTETRLSSVVQEVMLQAQQRLNAAETPLRLLQVLAILVAIASILAAAAYSFSSRRPEINVFFSRGHRPSEVALRSGLEAVFVSAVAVGLGLVVALLLARGAAGDTPVSNEAVRTAWTSAAWLSPIVVIGLGVMAGILFWRWRPTKEEGTRPEAVRWVLEVMLVGMAVWLLATTATAPGRLGAPQVAAPLAVLAATAVIAARLLQGALTLAARTSLPQPIYIAVRRAAVGRVGFLLFSLAVTFFGVFQHGLSIASTLEDTVVAKSRLFVGSDVAATVDVGDVPPEDLPWPATPAWRIPHVDSSAGEVDVIAVDPETLAGAAHWDQRFGADSLATLMAELSGSSAIAVGGDEGGLGLSLGGTEIEVDQVAAVDAFPGMLSERPAVVVSQDYLRDSVEEQGSGLLSGSAVTAEWWIRGEPTEITGALPGLEDSPYSVITAEEVRDIPYIATTLATFRILDALGLVGAALVIVASLAYLQSKERARAVSSQLAIRMGMSRRTHALAAVIELALFIVVAYGVAVVPAVVTARVLAVQLDPLQTIPPDVLFDLPLGWITAGGAAAIISTVVGGVLVARRALKASMAILMRVAE